MSDNMRGALLFLIETLFNLYLFVLVVRMLLVWIRSDYYHPVTQFVVKMTDWVVQPMRRFLPNVKHIETSTLLLIFVIEIVKFYLTFIITYGVPNFLGVAILSIGDMMYLLVQTFTYAIILQAILSLIQPNSPIAFILYRITAPILQPISRLLPQMGTIDLSPIPALIILQLIKMLIVTPIMQSGLSFALNY